MPPTKVFAKAGLDNVTSGMCKHQQRFGIDIQCSDFVFNFNKIFSIGHLYRAGQSINSQPSQNTLTLGVIVNLLKIIAVTACCIIGLKGSIK
jgi:hypothetical protein